MEQPSRKTEYPLSNNGSSLQHGSIFRTSRFLIDHTLPKTNSLPLENRPSPARNKEGNYPTIHSHGRAVSRRVILPWLSWSPSSYLNQVTWNSTSPADCRCLRWDICPENQFGWMFECISTLTWTLIRCQRFWKILGASRMATTTTTTTTTTAMCKHVLILFSNSSVIFLGCQLKRPSSQERLKMATGFTASLTQLYTEVSPNKPWSKQKRIIVMKDWLNKLKQAIHLIPESCLCKQKRIAITRKVEIVAGRVTTPSKGFSISKISKQKATTKNITHWSGLHCPYPGLFLDICCAPSHKSCCPWINADSVL